MRGELEAFNISTWAGMKTLVRVSALNILSERLIGSKNKPGIRRENVFQHVWLESFPLGFILWLSYSTRTSTCTDWATLPVAAELKIADCFFFLSLN